VRIGRDLRDELDDALHRGARAELEIGRVLLEALDLRLEAMLVLGRERALLERLRGERE
jgi:hypothetical protein